MTTQIESTLGMADHGAKLTRNEFGDAQFEEPWRYERVQGRLVVMAPPGFDYQRPTNRIRDHLGAYALAHSDRVANVISEAWIVTANSVDRIADIGVYLVGAAEADKVDVPERVPEIVFETVSGGGEDRKRDYVDKRAEYLRIGVKEYVIVDRFLHRVTVLRRVRGRFSETELGPKETYTTPLLPGLKIPLNGII